MELTRHASNRMQQRGIPPLIMKACIAHGRKKHVGEGAMLYYFNKKARRHLEKEWGRPVTRRLLEFLDSYVIVGLDGAVITTGKHYKRIKAR